MNISPHLLIDAVILSTALTITLVLRAKGNAAKKENKWHSDMGLPFLAKYWVFYYFTVFSISIFTFEYFNYQI